MITDILLAAALVTASSVGNGIVEPTSVDESSTRGVIYIDENDTTSFANCGELSEDSLEYAEVYGDEDVYDYVSYTAAYTRNIYLIMDLSDGAEGRIDVYRPNYSMSEIWYTFTHATVATAETIFFIEQGETLYFRISCTSCCWWRVFLSLHENPSGYSYYAYSHFNGYSMPHSGPATIYYKKDESCYQYVTNQNFTFSSVIDDAIDVWESVGNVTFVESASNALFTITMNSSLTDYQVYHGRRPLTQKYYCSAINMPSNIEFFEDIILGWSFRGVPATIYDGVKGAFVRAFALSLGLMATDNISYYLNVTYNQTKPYGKLGDGDLRSFYALWGDPLDSSQ